MSTLKVDTVQSTGGSTIFTHSSGLFKPNALICQVKATDLDQSISANTVTKVNWETVVIDTGSYWDSTNHRYTSGVAGYYLCSGVIRSAEQEVSLKTLSWRKNGTQLIENRFQVGDDSLTSGGLPLPTTLIQVNGSGDYIDVAFQCEETMTLSTNDEPYHSEINIILVHAT